MRFVNTGVFVCRDALDCVVYGPDEPVRLASILDISGPVQDLGFDSMRAVELALARRGQIFGHSLDLRQEDGGCNPDAGEAAANAVAGDPTIAAVVGTSCSSAALVAAPILSEAGLSLVSPSNTSPLLTDPAGHVAGYLRTAHNDADNSRAMAQFVAGTGAMTSAVIVDGSPIIGLNGQAFADAFNAFGGTHLITVETADDGSQVEAALDEMLAAGTPDVLYLPVFDTLATSIVNAVRARPQLEGTILTTNDYPYSQEFIDGLGQNAEGLIVGLPDDSFTGSGAYADFATDYFAMHAVEPQPFFAAHAYDAATMILNAIQATGIVDGDGALHVGRQALRDALFATQDLEGVTGLISCDAMGDCGAVGFVQIEIEGAPKPLIVASTEGDWFWTSDFLPSTDLEISLYTTSDPEAALLWEGAAGTDESGFVLIGYEVHGVNLEAGNYLVISDGRVEDSLLLESITMDMFDLEQGLMAGTAPPERSVYVVAADGPDPADQTAIETESDASGAWSADFDLTFTDDWRPWSFAQIFDEDGDANEAGPPPAPEPEQLWAWAFTYDPPAGTWTEGEHSYYFERSHTEPEPGEGSTTPIVFTVDSGAPGYDGLVLLRPFSVVARIGDGCVALNPREIHPEQGTRFVWGWVTDAPMTYTQAVAQFESMRVWVHWDGGEGIEMAPGEIVPADEIGAHICDLSSP